MLELALVFVILWQALDLAIALATLATVVVYIAYTMLVTEWRTKFRRWMNEADGTANTRAVDSLLNYETVKYFGNERHEATRYDESLARYESASVRSQTSLAMLNIGQAAIISIGLTGVMLMTANRIVAGEMTLGAFVMANTYLMQLYQPLNFFGFVYRELKQGLIDIEKMFELMAEQAEIADAPDARPLEPKGGAGEGDHRRDAQPTGDVTGRDLVEESPPLASSATPIGIIEPSNTMTGHSTES